MKHRILGALFMIVGIPASAFSDEDKTSWYQVEVYIFARQNEAKIDELWRTPDPTKMHTPSEFINLDMESLKNTGTQRTIIRTATGKLNQAKKRLERGRAYRSLYHSGWRQRLTRGEETLPILVQGGEHFDGAYELEGSISLNRQRFLHVDANLWLKDYQPVVIKPIEDDDKTENSSGFMSTFFNHDSSDEPAPNTDVKPAALSSVDDALTPNESLTAFQENPTFSQPHFAPVRTVYIDESRKLRSGEVHYLDHPLFGVLVSVDQIETRGR